MSNQQTLGGGFLLQDPDAQGILAPENFSDEQKMFRQTAADFLAKEVLPRVAEIDEQKEGLSVSLLKKAGEIGLMSVDVPEEFGGLGLDKTTSMIVAEEMGRAGSFAVSFSAHTGIGTLPITYFGTHAQKEKYLPKLGTGELLSSYSLSEPGSGSDALAAKTTAVLNPEGTAYILNGTKMWLSNAGFADLYITFAKIDGEHFSAFIIEKGTPGVSLGAEEKKMGIKGSSTRMLILENAVVPKENLLHEPGKGHHVAFNILNIGRFKLGASVVGAAKYVISEAMQYAAVRKQFNQPIANFGMIKHKLAEMNIRTFAAESMVYRTAGLIDAVLGPIDKAAPDAMVQTMKGIEEFAIECSIVKVAASEILDYVVDEAVQIYGGYGFSEEYPVARAYRDSRINRIFEGTNEINRMLIPGMIAKRASKGTLPLLIKAGALAGNLTGFGEEPEIPEGPMAEEHRIIRNIKDLTVLMIGGSMQKFMLGLSDQQEVLMHLSDLVIETYSMESSLLRAEKSGNGFMQDIARVIVNDGVLRIDLIAKQLLPILADGDMLRIYLAALRRFTKSTPVNTAELRRKIADRMAAAGGYVVSL